MKAVSVLLLTISCAQLMHGAPFPAKSGPQPPQHSSTTRGAAHDYASRPSRRGTAETNRRIPVLNERARFVARNAANPPRPDSESSAGAGKDGWTHNQAIVRQRSSVASGLPPSGNARHRRPNPAIVGGLGNSNTRNAGVLNGTRINHRL